MQAVNKMNNFAILTGKTREHLISLPNPLSDNHFLQAEAVKAFLELQQAAKARGFNLQPASSFRDFERQRLIWNGKFYGERKVHDDQGNPLDLTALDDWQKAKAILRWSAMPGASRHHWGTEIDFFDPDLLPKGQKLQLEPWEYQTGGYFQRLTNWLLVNAEQFGFYFPFLEQEDKKIGHEPWHLSYFPIADIYQQQFSPDILVQAWLREEVAGKAVLLSHLDEIFSDFLL
ncbi:peptidase M15 [Canicola haemoglobinophilus]|uniref:D-alanyl-D-alanine carboxypeptidase-like protein n=2 Tax=Canicola haemoglobinophilus TaxID=733 RepID=A0A1V4B0L5_9PAST|nr:peptidase M15 [Canicola haemoglobinophilus]STO53718.1 D-alanyl-D-alanine carboxypeptidase-like protein [Canicola haemoglobinophilus]STO60850.1 D-alanyl-D-alanine carboxypeptidase-like protein [Canicola haemoglobinophilus]STO68251.1 D-alanyl-D-alanine carboxypeptidase-like protein [Canicola haemoglobinophilus]